LSFDSHDFLASLTLSGVEGGTLSEAEGVIMFNCTIFHKHHANILVIVQIVDSLTGHDLYHALNSKIIVNYQLSTQ